MDGDLANRTTSTGIDARIGGAGERRNLRRLARSGARARAAMRPRLLRRGAGRGR